MIPQDERKRLRELLAKATPGEVVFLTMPKKSGAFRCPGRGIVVTVSAYDRADDGYLYAAARNALPCLLDALDQAEKALHLCGAMAGNPDPAEACRLIAKHVRAYKDQVDPRAYEQKQGVGR